ncbi:MAG: protein phosphatase 2C domain-containing protein [Parabacteroides sp.]|nr:protein phosphatase 2C domain-containing protein [Parabacteroides sp.]
MNYPLPAGFIGFSHIGQKDNQEDSYYPKEKQAGENVSLPLFMVCDGVGGCENGEIASATVCQAFADYFHAHPLAADEPMTEIRFNEALQFAYKQLDRKAEQLGQADMATTLTFVYFHAEGCFVAHIGDSRVYLIRPGEPYPIKFQTWDHSFINELLRYKDLTQEEIDNHPMRHVITRSIQPEKRGERCEADCVNLDFVEPGDRLFLCSDGVLEKVDNETLARVLSDDKSPAELMARLETICEGSYDNYTALLVYTDKMPKRKWWQLWK